MKKLTALILTVFLLSAYVFAQSQTVYPEGLKAGDMAPLFSGKDQNGKIIKLSDALKKGMWYCCFTGVNVVLTVTGN